MVQQQLHDLGVAARRGVMQRRPAGFVDIGILGDQAPANVCHARKRCQHERALVIAIARLGLQTRRLQQQRQYRRRRLPDGLNQGMQALRIAGIGVKSAG